MDQSEAASAHLALKVQKPVLHYLVHLSGRQCKHTRPKVKAKFSLRKAPFLTEEGSQTSLFPLSPQELVLYFNALQ